VSSWRSTPPQCWRHSAIYCRDILPADEVGLKNDGGKWLLAPASCHDNAVTGEVKHPQALLARGLRQTCTLKSVAGCVGLDLVLVTDGSIFFFYVHGAVRR